MYQLRTPLYLAILLSSFATVPLHGQGFSPEQALRRMCVPDGFQVKLVASEPLVRQPLTMTFDGRGRLWVVQYLQYPTPAGLSPVRVDQYLRTTYDHVPEPPPRGPKGADRITILEDPDEHGRYRKAKDFVSGLNLASGLALGHGGVFVLQPPYLLFYSDHNHDDVPDGPPEVLLTGFGMEDAHAVANSLAWGPDGWPFATNHKAAPLPLDAWQAPGANRPAASARVPCSTDQTHAGAMPTKAQPPASKASRGL